MPLSGSLITPEAPARAVLTRFASDVRAGLMQHPQKTLPAEYFYDEVGSALFEVITVLPEYGLTRADRRILSHHSGEIAALATLPVSVLELGSGSGSKTAHLLRSIAKRQGGVDYYPIDVSGSALEQCGRALSSDARVFPIEATFIDGVREALRRVPSDHHVLLLFLGSTIGNFGRAAASQLIADVRSVLSPGDMMLIGADLVKPVNKLLLAYDDPAGVTGAFNLNLLGRINRELDANFDLRDFRHEARYDASQRRVEMHLVANRSHTVNIAGAGCHVHFRAGESIWTESSHKYELADLQEMAETGGFRVAATWTDREWPFAESLWVAGP